MGFGATSLKLGVPMQVSLLNRCPANPLLMGGEQSTGSRATIVNTTGSLFCTDCGIALHVWSRIASPGSTGPPPDARPFSGGSWHEAFARRNPQSD
jgi:hypothetical protein